MPLAEEQNYNQNQLELIQSGSSFYSFPENFGDYIHISIYEGSVRRAGLNSQTYYWRF